MRELRDDQTLALDTLRDAVVMKKRRIMMQCPTGWGKTVLASTLVESAHNRGKKVLFTVPMISLVDQTVDMFYSQGIYDVGVIQASHHMTDWSKPIQIASIQTLMKKSKLPQADVVLIDEAHKWFTFYERWLSKDKMPEWGNIPFIGLSATPWTKGLGSWYDHFYKASTIQQMIDAKNLSPFTVYAPSHPDLSGIKTVAGDYHEGQLSEKMQEGALVADAVDTWLKLWGKDKTLCYAVDRAHAKALQLKFQSAGVPCGYQDAFTKDQDRRQIKADFHAGLIKVVCNVGTLTTGVDWDVRCISMCRPTKSDMLFVQIVGRGLRVAEGKDQCVILDHSDNHMRLGFVTDIDESYIGLHDGKAPQHENRIEGIRLPKECPHCHYLKPPRMAKCPACGFVATVVSNIKPEAGELRELKPQPKEKREKHTPTTREEKLAFYAELVGYGERHGYKPGWASNKYRERTGVWPHDMKHVRGIAPRPDTVSWIKSRQIAWAKSKPREEVRQ
jgi:superfamily II DNA or RNA helicase